MPLPEPVPGLVVSYAFLWHDEAAKGQAEGRKDRPCVIVLSVLDVDGIRRVIVVPVTHSPPPAEEDWVEIPADTKRRLGLDGQRSWIVTSQANRFEWPGFDLRPVSREQPDSYAYGALPRGLFAEVQARVVRQARAGKLRITGRDL